MGLAGIGANPLRGMQFAKEGRSRGRVTNPVCLDLVPSIGVAAVKAAHDDLYARKAGKPLPKNRLGPDRLLRDLDCAVINHLHKVREAAGLPPFETVKAVFIEGDRIYDEAGFFEKTHIQICVRNRNLHQGRRSRVRRRSERLTAPFLRRRLLRLRAASINVKVSVNAL
jgi:hypothetical protein